MEDFETELQEILITLTKYNSCQPHEEGAYC